MKTNDTQKTILRGIAEVLNENPGAHYVGDQALADHLKLDLQMVQDYLDLMHADDLVVVSKTHGGWSVGLQAKGRLTLHDPTFVKSESTIPAIQFFGDNLSIGVLNTGQIEQIESISVSLIDLSRTGHDEFAESMETLTQAVINSQELLPERRSELLDQFEYLSDQATLEPGKRAEGVVKAVLSNVATTLGAVGSLAEIWSTWGPAICDGLGSLHFVS